MATATMPSPARPTPTPTERAQRSGPELVPVGRYESLPPFPLDRPVTLIGSRQRAHIRLESDEVSRSHAVVVNTGGRVIIRDLASRTHVYVNGREVSEAILAEGDHVNIGRFAFRFAAGDPAPRQPQAAAPDEATLDGATLAGETLDGGAATLDGPLCVLGCRRGVDLVLRGREVSFAHALIYGAGGRHFIRDLGSRTGTFVDDLSVDDEVELQPGSVIRLGSHLLRYSPAGAPPAKAPPARTPPAPAPAPVPELHSPHETWFPPAAQAAPAPAPAPPTPKPKLQQPPPPKPAPAPAPAPAAASPSIPVAAPAPVEPPAAEPVELVSDAPDEARAIDTSDDRVYGFDFDSAPAATEDEPDEDEVEAAEVELVAPPVADEVTLPPAAQPHAPPPQAPPAVVPPARTAAPSASPPLASPPPVPTQATPTHAAPARPPVALPPAIVVTSVAEVRTPPAREDVYTIPIQAPAANLPVPGFADSAPADDEIGAVLDAFDGGRQSPPDAPGAGADDDLDSELAYADEPEPEPQPSAEFDPEPQYDAGPEFEPVTELPPPPAPAPAAPQPAATVAPHAAPPAVPSAPTGARSLRAALRTPEGVAPVPPANWGVLAKAVALAEIPEDFTPPELPGGRAGAPRRRRALLMWVALIVLLAAAAGAALFFVKPDALAAFRGLF